MAAINEKYMIAAFPLPMGLILLPLIHTAGYDPGQRASAVAGWMLLLLVAQSITAIMAGALCRDFRWFCRAGIISGAAAMSAEALGCAAGLIPAGVILQTGAVFIGWGLFCTALASRIGSWSFGLTVPAGITIASMLIFSPVLLTPLFLALQHSWPHWPWLAEILVNISPAIWMINALATGIHYNWFIWFHAPMMYQHVVLGQNTLMPRLWPWWLACAAAGVAGIIMAAAPRRSQGASCTDSDVP